MQEKGWLLDLYEDEQDGLRLWFILENGLRICLRQRLPITFYVSGPKARLHDCCLMLHKRNGVVGLHRASRKDVFLPEPVTVLQIDTDNPVRQRSLFQQLKQAFPDLIYYDADLSVQIHHAARYLTFPMAYCDLTYNSETGELSDLNVLNSRWDVVPIHPLLRTLEIAPDTNPKQSDPKNLRIKDDRGHTRLIRLHDHIAVIESLNRMIEQADPDFIITNWGDDWLFPLLLDLETETGLRLKVNRDSERTVLWKREVTYFSYGQTIYRGREAHLFGRCHIDTGTATMWKDYGLAGTLESARVTSMSIEQAARVSPGSGISAMQMITALQKSILIPEQKQQVETRKTGTDLLQYDRGGLVYQPQPGIYWNVAQIDFVSMYPAIIIQGNISPEVPLPDLLTPATEELGIVPLTLKPLYEKRMELKEKMLLCDDHNTALAKSIAARSSALKWLLVVCFGFLGYKNARFGKIEAHEAVTRGGREALLLAKEACEAHGFQVLHMFVDALWIYRPMTDTVPDYNPVLEEISRRTGLKISLDGIYRWIAFLPSRGNDRQPVPNRYYGLFQDGSMKLRGIESRRRDLPPWVVETQLFMLKCLAKACQKEQLQDVLFQAFRIFTDELERLNTDQVPLEALVLTVRLSRDPDAYKVSSTTVRAAEQLMQLTGQKCGAGQKVSYIYTKNGVLAWDQPIEMDAGLVDKIRYRELLARAAGTIFCPFGIQQKHLTAFAQGQFQFEFKL